MKFLKALFVTMLLMVAAFSTAAPAKQYIELKKTDNYFSLNIQFEKCDQPSSFLAQDGAMNTFTFGDAPAIRFIVKKHSDGKIKYHPVTDEVYVHNGERVPGLKIQPGVSFDIAESAVAYKTAAVKSLKVVELSADSELVKSAVAKMSTKGSGSTPSPMNDYTPEPAPEVEKCCSGTGCGGQGFTFCTTGTHGCGGDGCASCCVGSKR